MARDKNHSYKEVYSATLEYFKQDTLATSVFVNKYALQDAEGNYLELTPDDMHQRLASEFAGIEARYENSMHYEEIYGLFKDFKYIVPQGSPMSGIGNETKIQSLSNCFVIESPADSYAGILKADQEQVQIMKRRGGVGFDISTIRPKGMPTSNAAKTTDGIEIFLDRFSNSCREVAQGGRRGALMLSISVHHPQVMEFIKIKRDITRVTGANISVRVTDEFMTAVKAETEYIQRWPVDSKTPEVHDHVDAKEVWDALIEGAHASAEPGVLFWDTATRMTPSDAYADVGFGSVSTNPCGEIILSPYDSCRLMLVNLTSFVLKPWTQDAKFDLGKFRKVTRKAQRLMDDMIDLEVEQIDKILHKIDQDPENSHVKYYERTLWEEIKEVALKGRRTGLGITGLGDAIAMLGQTYGSEESIKTTEDIYKWLSLASYEESIQLAKERGSFPIWDAQKEKDHPFLKRVLSELTEDVIQDYATYGRRNIANTTTAPAGSVSCLTQTTSGIEPAFQLQYTRRKKVQNDEKVMFIDDLGDEWTEFTVYHHKFKEWLDFWDKDYFEDEDDLAHAMAFTPYYGATANEIDWRAKVKLQSVAQKWICHAISNTTNLPADVSVETVKDIYMLGWELGCKGITVYRDGSRSGVLISADEKKERSSSIVDGRNAPKRPETLECDIHNTSVKGEQWVILVGLLNGKPYEVIGGQADMIEIPKKYTKGILTKRNFKTQPNKYDLAFGENGSEVIVKDVVSAFGNPNYAGYTRTISLALRHGVHVQYLVEQMQKDKEMDMFSFSKSIARCLKKYIEDGLKASVTVCTNCDAENTIIYQEGCQTCTSCGFGACG